MRACSWKSLGPVADSMVIAGLCCQSQRTTAETILSEAHPNSTRVYGYTQDANVKESRRHQIHTLPDFTTLFLAPLHIGTSEVFMSWSAAPRRDDQPSSVDCCIKRSVYCHSYRAKRSKWQDFTQKMGKQVISMGETENIDTITEKLTNSIANHHQTHFEHKYA